MIIEIATIRLKLTLDHTYNLNTDYLNKIIEMYKVDNTDEYDFELKTIKSTDLPSSIYEMESRNDALYHETEDAFIFETESWTSTIYWKKKVMTTMFFNEKSANSHDRLLIRSLKLLVSLLTLQKGGLPCHCSALTKNNKYSIIFPGQSNAGKTTIAILLSRKWNIYNDEFNIIMPLKNGYYVFSTPFTTPEKFTFCTYGNTPLRKIFFLQKSPVNKTEKMTMKQKYFSVLECVYTFPTSEKFSAIIMKNVEKISQGIPIEMLYFNHKSNIAKDIEKFIQE